VAVRTGCAAFLTVRRAFFSGFGANSRQKIPIVYLAIGVTQRA
jgi:hypothetical protein